MKYTVLVQRPDWIADPYGLDTYLAHVEAQGVFEAQQMARDQAWDADNVDATEDEAEVDESKRYDEVRDYAVLAVFEGHLNDVSQEE